MESNVFYIHLFIYFVDLLWIVNNVIMLEAASLLGWETIYVTFQFELC